MVISQENQTKVNVKLINPFRDIRTPSDALGRPNGFNFCNSYMVKKISSKLVIPLAGKVTLHTVLENYSLVC